jgi:serine/threonine protein kinase
VNEIDPLRAFGLLGDGDLLGEASVEVGQDQGLIQGPPVLNEVVEGRYRLLEELGRGAMGTVFLARDESLDREVAIKVLALEGEAVRTRFQREAEVTASIDHANVIRIHGSGQLRGHPYLVYELISGGRSLVDAFGSEPLEGRLDLVEGVAAGVAAAHAAGVVHRDLKPENVLVRSNGQPVVADFGLAGLNASSLTKTGQVFGTPAFMAPEQVRGEATTPRTDVWALGLILYEAIYQRHGISSDGALANLLTRICEGRLEFPAGGPPALRALVKATVVVDPSQRQPDAAAFLAALRAARAETARIWHLVSAAGLAVVALLILGAWALSDSRAEPSPEPTTRVAASPAQPSPSPSVAETPGLSQKGERWGHGLEGVKSACFLGERLVVVSRRETVIFEPSGTALRRFSGSYELLRPGASGAWFRDEARTYRLAKGSLELEEVWAQPALDCDPHSSEFLVRLGRSLELRRHDGTLARELELPLGTETKEVSAFLTPSYVLATIHQPTLNLTAPRAPGDSQFSVYMRLVTRVTALGVSPDRKLLALGNPDGVVLLTTSPDLLNDVTSFEPGGQRSVAYRRLSTQAHVSTIRGFLFHEHHLITISHSKRWPPKAALWDSRTGKLIARREEGTFKALALHESGLVAIVGPVEVAFVRIEDFR